MVTSAILVIAYIVYAVGKYETGLGDLKSWAIFMLIFIGIGVGIQIVIQIAFHIALAFGIAVKEHVRGNEETDKMVRTLNSSMVKDEMDKLIDLKSARFGYIFAGIGFFISLLTLAFGASGVLALHVILGAFVVGAFIENIVSIYFYEKGVSNG
jgi:hypothetical protein